MSAMFHFGTKRDFSHPLSSVNFKSGIFRRGYERVIVLLNVGCRVLSNLPTVAKGYGGQGVDE